MKPSSTINIRLNTLLIAAAVFVNVHQFFLLPLFLLPMNSLWLITLLPCALLSNSLWYLMHEAFHSNLYSNPRINDAAGRSLAVLFGAPYHVVRFGHLMHHRFNGAPQDRPDLYNPAMTSRPAAVIRCYWGLCIGLYISEMLSIVLFLLPKNYIPRVIRQVVAEKDQASQEIANFASVRLTQVDTLSAIRIDGIATISLLIASSVLYGPSWYVLLYILLVRGFLISLANNLPHYGTNPVDVKYALNIRMPNQLSLLYLNFNHHRIHHHNPLLPWTALKQAFQQSGETYDITLSLAVLAQFMGPIPRDRFNAK